MKRNQNEEGELELLKGLASRFRAERLKLGLSTSDVAHYCGVSASSVFSWEAGRSRIPLSVAASLWEHGFDAETVVAGKVKFRAVPVYGESVIPDASNADCFVPEHILQRHNLKPGSGEFAILNNAISENIASPCDLLLMSPFSKTADQYDGTEIAVLFKPGDPKFDEFLCKIKSSGRGRIRLESGNVSGIGKTQSIFDECVFIGKFHCRIGIRQPKKVSSITHSQRLNAFLRYAQKHSRAK